MNCLPNWFIQLTYPTSGYHLGKKCYLRKCSKCLTRKWWDLFVISKVIIIISILCMFQYTIYFIDIFTSLVLGLVVFILFENPLRGIVSITVKGYSKQTSREKSEVEHKMDWLEVQNVLSYPDRTYHIYLYNT